MGFLERLGRVLTLPSWPRPDGDLLEDATLVLGLTVETRCEVWPEGLRHTQRFVSKWEPVPAVDPGAAG